MAKYDEKHYWENRYKDQENETYDWYYNLFKIGWRILKH